MEVTEGLTHFLEPPEKNLEIFLGVIQSGNPKGLRAEEAAGRVATSRRSVMGSIS